MVEPAFTLIVAGPKARFLMSTLAFPPDGAAPPELWVVAGAEEVAFDDEDEPQPASASSVTGRARIRRRFMAGSLLAVRSETSRMNSYTPYRCQDIRSG